MGLYDQWASGYMGQKGIWVSVCFGPWDKQALGGLGGNGRLKLWGIWSIRDSAHLEYYAHLLCHTIYYFINRDTPLYNINAIEYNLTKFNYRLLVHTCKNFCKAEKHHQITAAYHAVKPSVGVIALLFTCNSLSCDT